MVYYVVISGNIRPILYFTIGVSGPYYFTPIPFTVLESISDSQNESCALLNIELTLLTFVREPLHAHHELLFGASLLL